MRPAHCPSLSLALARCSETDVPEREQLHRGPDPDNFDRKACAAWVWDHLVGGRRGGLAGSRPTLLLEDGVREVEGAPPPWYGHATWQPRDLRGQVKVRRAELSAWPLACLKRACTHVPQQMQAWVSQRQNRRRRRRLTARSALPPRPLPRTWRRTAACMWGGRSIRRTGARGGATPRRKRRCAAPSSGCCSTCMRSTRRWAGGVGCVMGSVVGPVVWRGVVA